jgi:hypothetical protein
VEERCRTLNSDLYPSSARSMSSASRGITWTTPSVFLSCLDFSFGTAAVVTTVPFFVSPAMSVYERAQRKVRSSRAIAPEMIQGDPGFTCRDRVKAQAMTHLSLMCSSLSVRTSVQVRDGSQPLLTMQFILEVEALQWQCQDFETGLLPEQEGEAMEINW